jgi:cysteine-rich repeat protein
MMPAVRATLSVKSVALGVIALSGCSVIADLDHDYGLTSGGGGGEASSSASAGSSVSSGAGGSVGQGGSVGSGGGSAGGAGGVGGEGGSVGQGGGLCGNGVIDTGEECDDKNGAGGDGCEACQVVCMSGAIEEPVSHHCYFFSVAAAPWDVAKAACEEAGYHLAVITSQAEMDFLKNVSAADNWLGGKKANGAWTWVTNEPWSYAPWEPGQPSNNGDCIELGCAAEGDAGVINDQECATVSAYLCEQPPPGTL